MRTRTYLDWIDHDVAGMLREDYRTVLFTYDHSATPITGLVADFLAFITVVDDRTILELTDQYVAAWLDDYDPFFTHYAEDNYEV